MLCTSNFKISIFSKISHLAHNYTQLHRDKNDSTATKLEFLKRKKNGNTNDAGAQLIGRVYKTKAVVVDFVVR